MFRSSPLRSRLKQTKLKAKLSRTRLYTRELSEVPVLRAVRPRISSSLLSYKTVHPCFHSLQAGSHSPTHHNYITLALIAKSTLTLLYSTMVQIKLSLVFVLAVAAITSVLALPVRTLENGSVLYGVIDD